MVMIGEELEDPDGCDVEARLPILLVASTDDYSPLPTDSCLTKPQLIDAQVPGDCASPCGLFAYDVASTLSEDIDDDERRNEEDNCVHEPNTDQMDSGAYAWLEGDQPEGTGDVCQCGEATSDGSISSDAGEDLQQLRDHLAVPDPVIESRCSVNLDEACTIMDAVILKQTLGQDIESTAFESSECEAATGT
ncbi:MAG: hypothetical protein VCC04_15480 [Myxococcota bacterium]